VRLWAEPPDVLTGLLGGTPMERFLGALAVAPPDAETAAFVAAVAESWNRTLEAAADDPAAAVRLPDLEALEGPPDPSRYGYYFLPDRTDPSRSLLLVRVYPHRDFTSLTAISDQVDAIREEAEAAASGFPEFRVGITGRPALEADEMRTTDRDTTRAEIAALTTVFMAMVVMLASVRLAAAAVMALVVGIGWTFGFATLAVGELNLLSIVFLIALIGIGMDYLVQILSRYRAEAGRHGSVRELWTEVFGQVAAPINTACLGAAGAFFVAVLSDFKGAADLGIIAGAGLLLCLLSGYTVLPALLTVLPLRMRPEAEPMVNPASRPDARRGRRWLVSAGAWAVVVAAAVPLAGRVRFDAGLINLQATDLESVKLVSKLETWSAVVMSKDLERLKPVRASLESAGTVAYTESLLDAVENYEWLHGQGRLPQVSWTLPTPIGAGALGSMAERAGGLVERFAGVGGPGAAEEHGVLEKAAAELRKFSEKVTGTGDKEQAAARLSAWQDGFVAMLREQLLNLSPPPLDVASLPRELRSHYVSDDGTLALYAYPKEDLWERAALERFVEEVESRISAAPGALPVTGIAPNIYHSTESIRRSFYLSTLYALGLVFVLVLMDLRRVGQTLLAVSVLGLGLPVLAAVMALAGVPWNFANFFGLPILIGAGHEYGVFLVHRYREARADPARAWRGWDPSDNALLLCAMITFSAFGFFWLLAHHQGLKSLGMVMAVGTVCIYLAGLLALRPMLKWILEGREARKTGKAAAHPAVEESRTHS
jgi:uncharacterized protein